MKDYWCCTLNRKSLLNPSTKLLSDSLSVAPACMYWVLAIAYWIVISKKNSHLAVSGFSCLPTFKLTLRFERKKIEANQTYRIKCKLIIKNVNMMILIQKFIHSACLVEWDWWSQLNVEGFVWYRKPESTTYQAFQSLLQMIYISFSAIRLRSKLLL